MAVGTVNSANSAAKIDIKGEVSSQNNPMLNNPMFQKGLKQEESKPLPPVSDEPQGAVKEDVAPPVRESSTFGKLFPSVPPTNHLRCPSSTELPMHAPVTDSEGANTTTGTGTSNTTGGSKSDVSGPPLSSSLEKPDSPQPEAAPSLAPPSEAEPVSLPTPALLPDAPLSAASGSEAALDSAVDDSPTSPSPGSTGVSREEEVNF
jgi:hypothetical protein